ncbi:MAG: hypothetical protein CSA62_07700 [Planctomycetota bacterium]|nr:MAG: hypothetical protein CSA62_07700 [Planctomycetota bacterium]
MKSYMLSVLTFLVATCSVQAQLPVGVRAEYSAKRFYEVGAEKGSLVVEKGSATLQWSILSSNPVVANPVTAVLPFDQVGDVQFLDNKFFLISGWSSSSSQGWLVWGVMVGDASSTTRSIALVVQKNYGAAFDLVEFHWVQAESRVYAVNAKSTPTTLIGFSWSGSGAFPESSSFEAIADTNSPGLSDLELLKLYERDGVGGVRASLPVCIDNMGFRGGADVALVGGAWRISELVAAAPSVPAGWEVSDSYYTSANGVPLYVRGHAGSFAITNLVTGVDAYTGSSVSATQWVSVPSTTMLAGFPYRVTGAGAVESNTLWPLTRYGYPEGSIASDGATSIGRGFYLGADLRVGNADFRVAGDLAISPPVTVPTSSATVALWVGVDGPGAVSIVNGVSFLTSPAIAASQSVAIDADSRVGSFVFDFPVDSDPGLEGVVPLFQFVALLPSNEVVVSDIFGSPIMLASQGAGGARALVASSKLPGAPYLSLRPTMAKLVAEKRDGVSRVVAKRRAKAFAQWIRAVRASEKIRHYKVLSSAEVAVLLREVCK